MCGFSGDSILSDLRWNGFLHLGIDAMAELQLAIQCAAGITVLVCNGKWIRRRLNLDKFRSRSSMWTLTAPGAIPLIGVDLGPCYWVWLVALFQHNLWLRYQPHFQNTKLLDAILKSEIIQDRAKSSWRIVVQILKTLNRLHSLENSAVKQYLTFHFKHSEWFPFTSTPKSSLSLCRNWRVYEIAQNENGIGGSSQVVHRWKTGFSPNIHFSNLPCRWQSVLGHIKPRHKPNTCIDWISNGSAFFVEIQRSATE